MVEEEPHPGLVEEPKKPRRRQRRGGRKKRQGQDQGDDANPDSEAGPSTSAPQSASASGYASTFAPTPDPATIIGAGSNAGTESFEFTGVGTGTAITTVPTRDPDIGIGLDPRPERISIFTHDSESHASKAPLRPPSSAFGFKSPAIMATTDYRALYDQEIGRRTQAETHLKISEDQYEGQRRHISDIEGQLEELQAQEQELRDLIAEKDKEIRGYEEDFEKNAYTVDEAQDEVVKLIEEKKKLEQQIEGAKTEGQGKQNEIYKKNKDITELNDRLNDAQDLILQRTKERDDKEIELEELKRQYGILKDNHATLEEELGKFTAMSDELAEAVKATGDHIAAMAERDTEIRNLRSKLNFCLNNHDNDMPEDADLQDAVVPVVGEQAGPRPRKKGRKSMIDEGLKDPDDDEAESSSKSILAPSVDTPDQGPKPTPALAPIHTIYDQQPVQPTEIASTAATESLDPSPHPPLSTVPIHTITSVAPTSPTRPAAPTAPTKFTIAPVTTIYQEEPRQPSSPQPTKAARPTPPTASGVSVSTQATATQNQNFTFSHIKTLVNEPPTVVVPLQATYKTLDSKWLLWGSWVSWIPLLLMIVCALQTIMARHERNAWLGANDNTQRLLWAFVSVDDSTLGFYWNLLLTSALGLSDADIGEARSSFY